MKRVKFINIYIIPLVILSFVMQRNSSAQNIMNNEGLLHQQKKQFSIWEIIKL